jgi:hypothetical protein
VRWNLASRALVHDQKSTLAAHSVRPCSSVSISSHFEQESVDIRWMQWNLTFVVRRTWTTITTYSAPHQSRLPRTSFPTLSASWSTKTCSDPHTLRSWPLSREDPQSFTQASFKGFTRFTPLFGGNVTTPNTRSPGIPKSSESLFYLGVCHERQITRNTKLFIRQRTGKITLCYTPQ